jgi:hypothetical protein
MGQKASAEESVLKILKEARQAYLDQPRDLYTSGARFTLHRNDLHNTRSCHVYLGTKLDVIVGVEDSDKNTLPLEFLAEYNSPRLAPNNQKVVKNHLYNPCRQSGQDVYSMPNQRYVIVAILRDEDDRAKLHALPGFIQLK